MAVGTHHRRRNFAGCHCRTYGLLRSVIFFNTACRSCAMDLAKSLPTAALPPPPSPSPAAEQLVAEQHCCAANEPCCPTYGMPDAGGMNGGNVPPPDWETGGCTYNLRVNLTNLFRAAGVSRALRAATRKRRSARRMKVLKAFLMTSTRLVLDRCCPASSAL